MLDTSLATDFYSTFAFAFEFEFACNFCIRFDLLLDICTRFLFNIRIRIRIRILRSHCACTFTPFATGMHECCPSPVTVLGWPIHATPSMPHLSLLSPFACRLCVLACLWLTPSKQETHCRLSIRFCFSALQLFCFPTFCFANNNTTSKQETHYRLSIRFCFFALRCVATFLFPNFLFCNFLFCNLFVFLQLLIQFRRPIDIHTCLLCFYSSLRPKKKALLPST